VGSWLENIVGWEAGRTKGEPRGKRKRMPKKAQFGDSWAANLKKKRKSQLIQKNTFRGS